MVALSVSGISVPCTLFVSEMPSVYWVPLDGRQLPRVRQRPGGGQLPGVSQMPDLQGHIRLVPLKVIRSSVTTHLPLPGALLGFVGTCFHQKESVMHEIAVLGDTTMPS